jgi:hypothetical protein
MDDVHDAVMDGATHPGQAEFDQAAFVADLPPAIGPEAPEGDWNAEYYDRSVVINMPNAAAIEWLPIIYEVAKRHSLNVAAEIPEFGLAPDLPDEWMLAEGENDGQPMLARFNEAAKVLVGAPGFNIQIGVAVPFNAPGNDGMPSEDDMAQLEAFEETLIEHAAPRAVLVGVITTGGMREFVLYAGASEWIEGFHRSLQSAMPTHDIHVMAQEDSDWSTYRAFVEV